MVLVNTKTGELRHSHRYKERFRNLNTSGHNYLRITRILKCLGELGFEHLKFGFCEFVLNEVCFVHTQCSVLLLPLHSIGSVHLRFSRVWCW
jgi:hypothetical protein